MRTLRAGVMMLAVIAAIVIISGCGEKETLEQKVQRLRYNHEIFPVAAKTMYDAGGNPSLLVDLQVANQGSEALSKLTVLVKVLDADGALKVGQRVTLDLADVRPGVGSRVSASLPGIELLEQDEIMVELETGLSDEEVRQLPEYDALSTAS